MHEKDITAPSTRQSLAAMIIVFVLAGVIVTRSGSPETAQADAINSPPKQQDLEQSKLAVEYIEKTTKEADEGHQ